jgi:hypothetical protein
LVPFSSHHVLCFPILFNPQVKCSNPTRNN